MVSRPDLKLRRIVLDVADLERATRFWTKALGYAVRAKHPTFVALHDPKDPRATQIGFQPAEGAKPEVNAVHFEVFTDDMEREAKRLEKLGATRAPDWPYGDDDPNWIVMRDPDGHEFCVVEKR